MSSAARSGTASSLAMTAIGAFLLFGGCMSFLAGVTLVGPGTPLDRVWALNPTAYAKLATHGGIFGPLFLFLSATMASTAIGWFQRRRWGWRLATAIMLTQVAGDFINLVRGELLRGGAGLLIASALLIYLLRPNVRNAFH